MKRGKKYQEASKLIVKEFYDVDEALELLKKTSVTKFDSACELHLNLGIDPKQADQNLRTTVSLPAGTGKEVRVVAFVGEENVAAAKAAGASEAGTTDLVEKVGKGWLDFDVAIATPDQMKNLGKIAKTLGQKRLMPSPKAGTVTTEFEDAIKEVKKGKIEMRVDKQGNMHLIFGKASFDVASLKENFDVILNKVMEIKPSSSKGTYIKSVALTTSMGPSIMLDVSSLNSGK